MAIEPVKWPAFFEWRQVLARTWKEAGDDNVGLLAAGVAFYGFLAFVPLLASVVLTYGLIADPRTVAEHIGTLARTLPREAAAIIADQLQAITGDKEASHGIGLLLAIGLAFYGASKGAGAVVTALNIAYEVKETRGFIKTTLMALAMTAGLALMVLAAAGAISALAFIEHLLPFSSPAVHVVLQLLFVGLALAIVATGIALLYRYAPNRPDAPWRWITPGSAAATILWLLATLGFGLYVSNFGNYNATYGSLGGVVVFLTWLYLTGYILLMGGELNSELERQQALAAGRPAKIGDEVGPLLGATDASEGHGSVGRDRFRIGDEAIEQGRVPAAPTLGEQTKGGRIVEAGRGGDAAADDPVETRPAKVVLSRFQRMASIAFLIGGGATLWVRLVRGRRDQEEEGRYYRYEKGPIHFAPPV